MSGASVRCACHYADPYDCYNSRYPVTLDDCFRYQEIEERREAGERCECSCHTDPDYCEDDL